MPELLNSKNDASILVENLLVEMQTILPMHFANVFTTFKMPFSDMANVCTNFKPGELPNYEVKVELETMERLKEMCKRIEIVGNMLQAVTDVAKKNKFEEDLKKEEDELKTFLAKEETIYAFTKLSGVIWLLGKEACKNKEMIKETVDELLINFNKHTKLSEFADRYAAIDKEIEQLIGIDEEEHDGGEGEEDDKENQEETNEKLEISGQKNGDD